jgi:hypothetical protein
MSCALDNSEVERSPAPAISFAAAVAKKCRRADEIMGTERRTSYFHWKADHMWLRFPVSVDEANFIASNPAAFGMSLSRVRGFELDAVFAALPEDDPARLPFAVVDMRGWNLENGHIDVLFQANRHAGFKEDTGELCEYWGNSEPAKESLYRARWAFTK